MDKHSDSRIENLLGSMTLEEKIGQLTMVQTDDGESGVEATEALVEAVRTGRVGSVLGITDKDRIRLLQDVAVSQSRLGIPLLVTLDVLHGYRTIFPIPLGEAAAFNPPLWEETARAAALEATASGIALTLAPMLDVARDPRWGRMAESPGEDPWLASRFAEAKVRGFQQRFAGPCALAATAKHLGAYGAVTAGRDYASVDVSARSLQEVHLPAFEAAVRAGVAAVMPAFTDLAGVPMTANTAILQGVLRKDWGFEGVIISDFRAVAELLAHGVAGDLAEAAALAMNAGVDIDMAGDAYTEALQTALRRNLVDEASINRSVRRVLTLKSRLLLLDGAHRHVSGGIQSSVIEHRALARDGARCSIVLLQNRGDLLPLRGPARHLAILGPLAAAPMEMLGPWCAKGDPAETTSFLSGICKALPDWHVVHEPGTGILEPQPASFAAALEAATNADIIVLCLGESRTMCGEAASRAQPDLPLSQRSLAEAVLNLGKPIIVTLTSGRPLVAPWLFEKAQAVLATWFLGTEAGSALGDVLSGQYAPSGKLPVTWPLHAGQIPIFYAQRPTGRPADPDNRPTSGYIDLPSEPQFTFGHGLSYTSFRYRDLRLSQTAIESGGSVTIEVDISNEGMVSGEEIAFLFIRDPVASVARPLLELRGATRISLAPGKTGTVRFELACEDMAFPDEEGVRTLERGVIEILVGPKADRKVLLKQTLRIISSRPD